MPETIRESPAAAHAHVFLGEDHDQAKRRTWFVIWLCLAMMALEIVGGTVFGSIALVADGLHMSTHAGALLLAALAYSYARRHEADERFTFGTGKLGDLAGFSSAIILAMIAVLIGYEATSRFFAPVPIRFAEAVPIACLGLAVNVTSAWLLSGGANHQHHHGHHHAHHTHDAPHRVPAPGGALLVSIFEDSHPPVFRIKAERGDLPHPDAVSLVTVRPGGARQVFPLAARGDYLQSVDAIPEPHAFTALLRLAGEERAIVFEEHGHDAGTGTHRDNNMRAAIIHVAADAAVSVMVIIGLLFARAFGWLWMDPLAGIVGACVIASWSYGLIRDTGAILLDMVPDRHVGASVRNVVEQFGDVVADLHVWRLGPGHLGVIVSVQTNGERDAHFYRGHLAGLPSLSHVTVEVLRST